MRLRCGCPCQGCSHPSPRGSLVHGYVGRGEVGGGFAGVPYLMGLNMAFPKSWNLRTSFRCTPLGFTTWGGNGTLAAWKASPVRGEARVTRCAIQLSTPVSASHRSFELPPSASAVIFPLSLSPVPQRRFPSSTSPNSHLLRPLGDFFLPPVETSGILVSWHPDPSLCWGGGV